MIRRHRLLHDGRVAAIDTRLRGQPPRQNPYRPQTKSHLFWDWGFEQGQRLIDQLMEFAP